jgi:hypothetical protein
LNRTGEVTGILRVNLSKVKVTGNGPRMRFFYPSINGKFHQIAFYPGETPGHVIMRHVKRPIQRRVSHVNEPTGGTRYGFNVTGNTGPLKKLNVPNSLLTKNELAVFNVGNNINRMIKALKVLNLTRSRRNKVETTLALKLQRSNANRILSVLNSNLKLSPITRQFLLIEALKKKNTPNLFSQLNQLGSMNKKTKLNRTRYWFIKAILGNRKQPTN